MGAGNQSYSDPGRRRAGVFRTRNQEITCDMNHNYQPEQKAVDGGKMDKFVENTTGTKG